MSVLLASLLLACGRDEQPVVPGPGIWIEQAHVQAGDPVLLHVPSGTELPALDTLRVTQRSTGDDGSAVYELRGQPGSYVVDVPGADGAAVRLFFDIGVEGPSAGPLEDLVPLEPPAPSRWPWVVAATAGVFAFAAGLIWAARRLRPPPTPPPPESADARARREWRRLRERTDLRPEDLARELSDVYRRYLDDTRSWPASARTTREIVDNLAGELTALELDRARRLLGAMDLVKFSDRGAQAAVFEQLDADFSALVQPASAHTNRASDRGASGGPSGGPSHPDERA